MAERQVNAKRLSPIPRNSRRAPLIGALMLLVIRAMSPAVYLYEMTGGVCATPTEATLC
jgi:hypothetical protein